MANLCLKQPLKTKSSLWGSNKRDKIELLKYPINLKSEEETKQGGPERWGRRSSRRDYKYEQELTYRCWLWGCGSRAISQGIWVASRTSEQPSADSCKKWEPCSSSRKEQNSANNHNGKEMASPLEPAERNAACRCLDFSSVEPALHFWAPALSGNTHLLLKLLI